MWRKYTVIWAVLYCFFSLQNVKSCTTNPKQNITCDSLEDFIKAGHQPEWTNLTIQNAGNNPKQILKEDFFKNVTNLKVLNISGAINGFEDSPFNGLDNLESLILEFNDIKELPEPNIFDGLNIKRLEIKHSNIEAIPSDYFRNLNSLKQLDLTNNSISLLGDCAFCDLNNTVVILSQNKLTSFNAHKILGTTSLIEGIELENNKLSEILRFGQMFNLRGAKFSHNTITQIDDEAFLNSPRLMLLDLSHNSITEIPITSLPESVRRDERFVLKIHSNYFKCLKPEFREKFTALRQLTINCNPWECACLEQMQIWTNGLNATLACELDPCLVRCTLGEHQEEKYVRIS